jgi:hypothetical protein
MFVPSVVIWKPAVLILLQIMTHVVLKVVNLLVAFLQICFLNAFFLQILHDGLCYSISVHITDATIPGPMLRMPEDNAVKSFRDLDCWR